MNPIWRTFHVLKVYDLESNKTYLILFDSYLILFDSRVYENTNNQKLYHMFGINQFVVRKFSPLDGQFEMVSKQPGNKQKSS